MSSCEGRYINGESFTWEETKTDGPIYRVLIWTGPQHMFASHELAAPESDSSRGPFFWGRIPPTGATPRVHYIAELSSQQQGMRPCQIFQTFRTFLNVFTLFIYRNSNLPILTRKKQLILLPLSSVTVLKALC